LPVHCFECRRNTHKVTVLAGDYELADELDLARELFAELIQQTPDQAHEIQQIIADLEATDH
jgi:hypothetical protein